MVRSVSMACRCFRSLVVYQSCHLRTPWGGRRRRSEDDGYLYTSWDLKWMHWACDQRWLRWWTLGACPTSRAVSVFGMFVFRVPPQWPAERSGAPRSSAAWISTRWWRQLTVMITPRSCSIQMTGRRPDEEEKKGRRRRDRVAGGGERPLGRAHQNHTNKDAYVMTVHIFGVRTTVTEAHLCDLTRKALEGSTPRQRCTEFTVPRT